MKRLGWGLIAAGAVLSGCATLSKTDEGALVEPSALSERDITAIAQAVSEHLEASRDESPPVETVTETQSEDGRLQQLLSALAELESDEEMVRAHLEASQSIQTEAAARMTRQMMAQRIEIQEQNLALIAAGRSEETTTESRLEYSVTNRLPVSASTLPQALDRLEALRTYYRESAEQNVARRSLLRSVGLLSGFGALVNTLTDGGGNATAVMGLVGGAAAASQPMVAPPARPPIYWDGVDALLCARAAVEPALNTDREASLRLLASAEANIRSAEEILNRVSVHRGRNQDEANGGWPSDIRDNFNTANDNAASARTQTERLAYRMQVMQAFGEPLALTVDRIEVAINRRLHSLDISLDAYRRDFSQSILQNAGGVTGQPGLFNLDAFTEGTAEFSRRAELLTIEADLDRAQAHLEIASAALNLLSQNFTDLSTAEITANLTECVEQAAGADDENLALAEHPTRLNLGNAQQLSATFDVDGGNAPYTASFIGSAPGLQLIAIDSGVGRFEVTASNATDSGAQAGQFEILVKDEEHRPLVVRIDVTGAVAAPPAAPDVNLPSEPNGEANETRQRIQAWIDAQPSDKRADVTSAGCSINLRSGATLGVTQTQFALCSGLSAERWATIRSRFDDGRDAYNASRAADDHAGVFPAPFIIDGLSGRNTDYAAHYYLAAYGISEFTIPAWEAAGIVDPTPDQRTERYQLVRCAYDSNSIGC